MSEYSNHRTAKASLRHAMPEADGNYFAIPTGINPTEDFSPQSIRTAMGLIASICGEDYSASDYLFISKIQYYPAE